jgi:hypothetical protein
MSEVAGDAALFLPRLKFGEDVDSWAANGASTLRGLLSESADDRMRRAECGRTWAKSFDADRAAEAYLEIYDRIIRGLSGRTRPDIALDEG